jgi:hypothetical protein
MFLSGLAKDNLIVQQHETNNKGIASGDYPRRTKRKRPPFYKDVASAKSWASKIRSFKIANLIRTNLRPVKKLIQDALSVNATVLQRG